MKKFRAAVVGYGNIGKFTVEALEAAPDFEIAGIVRRQGAKVVVDILKAQPDLPVEQVVKLTLKQIK
jgi:glyceraldehyde-3-phosphate dehydrogenase/erythrose-4-phosphate dehydrogenase